MGAVRHWVGFSWEGFLRSSIHRKIGCYASFAFVCARFVCFIGCAAAMVQWQPKVLTMYKVISFLVDGEVQVLGTGATEEEAIVNAAAYYNAQSPEHFKEMGLTPLAAVETLIENGDLELVDATVAQ
jgi:hypothetical protein